MYEYVSIRVYMCIYSYSIGGDEKYYAGSREKVIIMTDGSIDIIM